MSKLITRGLVLPSMLLALAAAGLSCACNQWVQGYSRYGVPITRLHYVCRDLLSSGEVVRAVGQPPTDSAQVDADAGAVRQADAGAPAGSAQRKRAEGQEHLTIEVCNGVPGSWFTVQRFPATSNLLYCAFDDAWVVAHKAKVFHFRQRPDGTKENSSYPSGHATEAAVLGGLLAALDPQHAKLADEMRTELAQNRLILKKHYPTDLEAGDRLGKWLLTKMSQSRAFKRDFAAAAEELKPYTGASNAPGPKDQDQYGNRVNNR